VTTYDNAPPLEGWQPPVRDEPKPAPEPLTIRDNIHLGEN
jgi:hypothetical protein